MAVDRPSIASRAPVAAIAPCGPHVTCRPRVSLPQPSAGLPRGKLRFRPKREYQEVLEDHCLPAGLSIKMDVSTGKNLACLGEGQTVNYDGAKDNYGAVGDAVRAAVTWDKPEPLYPGGPASIPHVLPGDVADYANWTWREYGHRVGVWRLFEEFDRAGVPTTCTINALTALERCQIVEAAHELAVLPGEPPCAIVAEAQGVRLVPLTA